MAKAKNPPKQAANESRAVLRMYRSSPQKLNLLAQQIRGLKVERALASVEAIEAYPSVTNFVLFRLRSGDTADVHARFLEQGVLVRDLSSWPGCAGCLRVSIGTAAENDRFIAALGPVFGSPPVAAR